MTLLRRTVGILGALGAAVGPLSACYQAELDPNALGVYVCAADIDCALGRACIDGVCDDPDGPAGPRVRVLEPPQLGVFDISATGPIPLVIGAEGLTLSSTLSRDPSAGYVEIMLDGAVVDTVNRGDLEAGVSVDSVLLPATAGLHHIGLVARRLDGTPFDGEGSHTSLGFWVDDGNEHVGILNPAPGSTIELGEDHGLEVEVASLNFAFANPGFVAPDDLELDRLGYVRLFVDAEVPSCLPSCNFDDVLPIVPAGLSRVNRMLSEQRLELPGTIGTMRIQAVAQTMTNAPYLRAGGAGEVVFHSVPVQSVAAVEL